MQDNKIKIGPFQYFVLFPITYIICNFSRYNNAIQYFYVLYNSIALSNVGVLKSKMKILVWLV